MRKSILLLIASSAGLVCGCSDSAKSQEEANKKLMLSYYSEPSEIKRLRFVSENYKQHNPTVADGKAAARAGFAVIEKKYPHLKQTVKRIAADGDLVWVHLHTVRAPGDRGLAMINIFRIENGKIAEHWEVVQPVPEKSANDNTMF